MSRVYEGEPSFHQFTVLIKSDLKMRLKYARVQLSTDSRQSVKTMSVKEFLTGKTLIILTDFWPGSQDRRLEAKVHPKLEIFRCTTGPLL